MNRTNTLDSMLANIRRVMRQPFGVLALVAVQLLAVPSQAAPALFGVTQISGGAVSGCVLMQDKTVQCWNMLGNGATAIGEFPTTVVGLSNVKALTSNNGVVCALVMDGAVKCWGYVPPKYLDNPVLGQTQIWNTPTLIAGLSPATALAYRSGVLCVVMVSGTVQCVGQTYGSKPQTINGVNNAVEITVGASYACALLVGGTVSCWGSNELGQLGRGSTGTSVYENFAALPVTGLVDVIAISAGAVHTCAVKRAGEVFCWGASYSGNLGDGTTTQSNVPVRAGTLDDATGISAGSGHVCATRKGGRVSCWGSNSQTTSSYEPVSGAVGTDSTNTALPITVQGVSDATSVVAGYAQSCAVLLDTTVLCWGAMKNVDRSTRSAVRNLTDIATISTGWNHTCATNSVGAAFCWGNNTFGQLGNGGVSTGGNVSPVLGLPPSDTVATGSEHSCAVSRDGRVWCWGRNHFGQLGDGTLVDKSLPTPVTGLSGARAVTVGWRHSCALMSGGTTKCWGHGLFGELGDGLIANSTTPVTVRGITNATALAALEQATCALLFDSTVSCWGYNLYGSLGNIPAVGSIRATPGAISGLANVASFASGYAHICSVLRSGEVFCFGSNFRGELGASSQGNMALDVVQGIVGATAVAAGGAHSCAVVGGGRVKCWGNNDVGQLGNGTFNDSGIPVEALGVSNAVAVNSRNHHSCAILSDRTAVCWGSNPYGQLGDGRQQYTAKPQPLLKAPARLTMTEFRYAPLNYYFMTSRDNEKTALGAVAGWSPTGQSFSVFAEKEYDTVAISRFYFDKVAKGESRGSHFYTGIDSERDLLRTLNPGNLAIPRKPFDEGIDSFAYAPVVDGIGGTCATGQIVLYRAFRGAVRYPDDPNHRFTTSLQTYNSLVSGGWTGEGVKLCLPVAP